MVSPNVIMVAKYSPKKASLQQSSDDLYVQILFAINVAS